MAVGLAVMVISVCVILGFKSEIQQKMTGIGAHIEVLDMKSLASPEDFPITAPTAFVQALARTQGVSRADRVAYKIGIIKTNDDFADITLKGLEANYDTAFLASCLRAGRLPLLDGTAETSEVAISQSVADDMHLKVGDKVFAYFFEQTIKMRRFTIIGIYETHMKMYDEVLAFTDFETVARLNAWEQEQCSEVEIRVEDNDRIGAVSRQIAALNQQYPEPTGGATKALLTIDQHYPQIFSWLELLDFNMVVILLLMVLVGGFTMVSGLLILILERTAT
ncbi:MAG: ABC transporter permease, partial [Bacteroidales bacterium]|nr:ABC transporter permease [Candidatus Equimonas enterica]